MVQVVHIYHVEVDLKPTDKNYETDLAEGQSCLCAARQSDVPWSYSPCSVPDGLSKKGVKLELWKRTVEGACQLWKERTVALGTVAQELKRRIVILCGIMILILVIAVSILSEFMIQDSDYFIWIMIGQTVATYIILISATEPIQKKYSERLSEFEQKWTALAQDLQEEFLFKYHGVTVKVLRAKVVKRGRRLAWTVGLRFSFQIQPVDQEEVSWCLANSQTTDIEDDEYENRKLRVTKASHAEGMAMANAVVDAPDGEAVPSSDVDTMNEKRTLHQIV